MGVLEIKGLSYKIEHHPVYNTYEYNILNQHLEIIHTSSGFGSYESAEEAAKEYIHSTRIIIK